MLVLFVEIALWSAVVYGRLYMVNLRSRWGKVVYYETFISRVRVEESMFCLLLTSAIIAIIFFYAFSLQVCYTAILYWINTVLIIIPRDSITRGWAAQMIGGYINITCRTLWNTSRDAALIGFKLPGVQFWIGRRITSFNYWTCFGLMILARLKYTNLGQLCFELEVAIEKLRRYKRPSIDQFQAEFDSSRRWLNPFWNT